jgi:TonB-dependent receptor
MCVTHAEAAEYRIFGNLIDKETGDPIIGGAVQIESTTIGALSDLDGNFVVKKVPEGTHTVIVRCVGYAEVRVTDVKVSESSSPKLELSLVPETLETGITIEVTAKAARNTDAALMKQRQLAPVISNAISSEEISRSGSGDAASALQRVTGASVVGSKYVYVRGLGGRYASTKLNGSALPSPDPDQQSLPMDIIPSNVLDNIVIEKSFSPDKPGDFAGGSVDLNTRQLTGKRFLKFSGSTGYNTQATSNDAFLTYYGGDADWAGFDDGTRSIPDIVGDPNVDIPDLAEGHRDRESAMYLDAIANSFNRTMLPHRNAAPVNQSYSLSYGDTYQLFERDMGVLASLSYSRDYTFYDDGRVVHWGNGYIMEEDFHDEKGESEVLWGGLANLTMPLNPKNKLSANYMYTRNAQMQTRYLYGLWPEAFPDENTTFHSRALRYLERSVGSLQLSGEHQIETRYPFRMEWQATVSNTSQDDPDFRTFANYRSHVQIRDIDTVFYGFSRNQHPMPRRTWRELDEKKRGIELNLSVPFHHWADQPGKAKFGTGFTRKTRHHAERVFVLDYDETTNINAYSPEALLADSMVGLIDTNATPRNPYRFGMYYDHDPRAPFHDYDSEQEIFSLYGMVELPVFEALRVITGVRYEKTLMFTENQAPSKFKRTGMLSEKDVLPSINITYALAEGMNLRAGYGKTLARPSMREFAPFYSQEYNTGYMLNGNPDLVETKIDNFDLRWEWFARPGELLAVSAFYKEIKDPIERALLDGNKNVGYINTEDATVYGVELEVRKRLDQVHAWLHDFTVGGNLTLVDSRIALAESKYRGKEYRPMQGQSPYVINLDMEYANPQTGTSVALLYNAFGERLADLSLEKTENPYEQPRHTIDLTCSQELWRGLVLRASGKNLLGARYERVIEYDGKEYVEQEHSIARTYSIGASYEF